MAHLLTDELWEQIAPLLPQHPSRPRGGRRPVDDRVALAGILFVLKTGAHRLGRPAAREVGCSGMTCWRRLRDWQTVGVWDALHRLLLAKLRHADRIDFSRVLVDGGSVRAVLGATRPARTRRTAGNSGRNITLWSRLTGFRWRRASRARTDMTARN